MTAWTAEQVEAAAKVIYADAIKSTPWDSADRESHFAWVVLARAALDAAEAGA